MPPSVLETTSLVAFPLFCAGRLLAADATSEIPLWPYDAPGFESRKGEKEVKTTQKNGEFTIKNVQGAGTAKCG